MRKGREAQAHELLEQLTACARAAGAVDVSTTLARGKPDDEVARFAASDRYTLVVVAHGCHDTIDQAFGSVTSAVIRTSSRPVLLAPPLCDTTFYARGKT